MYQVKLTARAKRELKLIPDRSKEAIAEVFEELKDDPTLGKPLTRELLRRYSYRIGLYRLIYQINHQDKIITIITAGHRAKVYKLPRQH